MSRGALHQVAHSIGQFDAVSDHTLLLQKWLRELGFDSHVYTLHAEKEMLPQVRPFSAFHPQPGDLVIYHHAIGSPLVEDLIRQQVRLILIYHNITPASFFYRTDPQLAAMTVLGRTQLADLREITALPLADSGYNLQELAESGFDGGQVLPLPIDPADYAGTSNPDIINLWPGDPLLLFVGRFAPNKRQEDLLKLLYAYRQIEPAAKLVLAGKQWMRSYVQWLENLIEYYGLEGSVLMPGMVSQTDLISYYRRATLYVSMSEHEGLGKPYLESMLHDLPVLAYGVTATPHTLGDAGIQFFTKDYQRLAQLIDLLVKDPAWQARLIARQKQRLNHFIEPAVKAVFAAFLRGLGLL